MVPQFLLGTPIPPLCGGTTKTLVCTSSYPECWEDTLVNQMDETDVLIRLPF